MSLTKLQEAKLRALPGFDDVKARVRCDEPLPYKEAQKMVQKAGIKTEKEFRAWKRNLREYRVLLTGLTQAKAGSLGSEFFGTGVPFVAIPYKDAQKLVQQAKLKSAREFYAWEKPEG